MRAWLPILVIGLAGCLQSAPADDGASITPPAAALPDWALRATLHEGVDPQHDHTDPWRHQGLSTPNFEIIGREPLVTEYHGVVAGAYYCGAVRAEGPRALAAYTSFYSDVALIVFDVTDPTQPEYLGELVLPLTHTYDATLTDDGRYAVVATSPNDDGIDGMTVTAAATRGPATGDEQTHRPGATGQHAITPLWRDACGQTFEGPTDYVPYASGVILIDLADPTTPTVIDYFPQPVLGAHSVGGTTIDGTKWIVASTTNLLQGVSYFSFFTIDEVAGNGKLNLYGTVSAQPPQTEGNAGPTASNGHVDGYLQRHPFTGQLLAYLANWDGGMLIFELEAPHQITFVSQWDALYQTHETIPQPALMDGRHITIVGQEIIATPQDLPTGFVALVDTTDPLSPRPLAYWTMPVDPFSWSDLNYSPHYPVLVNETLFVANYHGGVWAADASPASWPDMESLGVFVPADDPALAEQRFAVHTAPRVQDVNALPDGTLIVVDAASGAYAVRFDPKVPVPALDPYGGLPAFMGGA